MSFRCIEPIINSRMWSPNIINSDIQLEKVETNLIHNDVVDAITDIKVREELSNKKEG